jgi:hypothetical protein
MQLIVLNGKGEIVALEDTRRGRAGEEGTLFEVDLETGTYHFFLLMGHWERDYAKEAAGSDGTFEYLEDKPPTLLAAGLMEGQEVYEVTAEHNTGQTITITMWPMVVDTKFTTTGKTVEAQVNSGVPKVAVLDGKAWTAQWTLKQIAVDMLIAAQQLIDDGQNGLQFRTEPEGWIRKKNGGGSEADPVEMGITVSGNVVTGNLPSVADLETLEDHAGSVYFRLEYVPFNLKDGGNWKTSGENYIKSVFNLNDKAPFPVWIIRNGINDETQNENTDFTNFHRVNSKSKNPNANGNGAVRYETPMVQVTPDILSITEGEFQGPWNDPKPGITYTASQAGAVYYAVVKYGEEELPQYSDYIRLTQKAVAGSNSGNITVPNENGDYTVYLILYKEGNVSEPHGIDFSTLHPHIITIRMRGEGSTGAEISRVILVPVYSDVFGEEVYQTGRTGIAWAEWTNPSTGKAEDLAGKDHGDDNKFYAYFTQKFKVKYPHAIVYTFNKNGDGYFGVKEKADATKFATPSRFGVGYWGDMEMPWPPGIAGFYIFAVENDGYVRSYCNPYGNLAPPVGWNYLFYLKLQYVYDHYLLPMGLETTKNGNGTKVVNRDTTAYKDVLPVSFESWHNVISILKSDGVGNPPKADYTGLSAK